MAVTSSGLFLATKQDIIDATQLAYAPLADTLKLALYPRTTVTPNFETDTAYNVGTWASANEVSSAGYAAGGATLGSKSFSISLGVMNFLAADIIGTWVGVTFTAGCALMYDDTLAGNNAVYLCDFGADYAVIAQPFDIVWDPLGMYGEAF